MRQALTRGNQGSKPQAPSITGRQPQSPESGKAKTVSIQAPVKGWTSQESLVEAEEGTSVICDNFFPEAESLRLRRGYASHATAVGGPIRTLMPYVTGVAQKMFAARDNGTIYEVTAAGAAVSSYSTARTVGDYNWTMFGNSGGQYLYLCNGADVPLHYDGTAWVAPALTGPTISTLISVIAHKQRLWFVQKNTPDLYYLAVDAIAGALTVFPVSGQLTRGGSIQAISTWSLDGGAGPEDLFVVFSTEGEVVVYSGTDPSDASAWALQGTYTIGKPIGRKCVQKLGGDVLVITEDGLVPLSIALVTDRAAGAEKSFTRRIRRAYSDAVRVGADTYGWQVETHPRNQMALVNIPAVAGQPAQQFVMNVTSGAWARWTNMAATAWLTFQNNIYFGGPAGTVFKADFGSNDNGAPIPAMVLPAFSDLKAPGKIKYVTGISPIITSDVPNEDARPSIVCAVDYTIPDYLNQVAGETSLGSGNFLVWDVTAWDLSIWFGQSVTRKWRSGGGVGKSISPHLAVNLASSVAGNNFIWRLIGFDITYQTGEAL